MEKVYTLPEPVLAVGRRRAIQYRMAGDCWECTSHTKGEGGYPVVCRNSKYSSMSRYVWELFNSATIKKGHVIRHTCDNPGCINPAHLLEGTQADNVQDMMERGRHVAGMFKGEVHHNAKLSKREVWEIKHLLAYTTMTQMEIGKLYGYSQHKISVIKREKDWKHVTLDQKY